MKATATRKPRPIQDAGADLSRNLGGSPNLGAMILRGDANLTVAHIRKMAAYFKVEPEVFL
jgi:antitoxin component HigA of HigAB toxin-antitoxin module